MAGPEDKVHRRTVEERVIGSGLQGVNQSNPLIAAAPATKLKVATSGQGFAAPAFFFFGCFSPSKKAR